MICGLEFYSVDKVLFASDCPFDPEKGPGYIRDTIAIIEQLDITPEERENCFPQCPKVARSKLNMYKQGVPLPLQVVGHPLFF